VSDGQTCSNPKGRVADDPEADEMVARAADSRGEKLGLDILVKVQHGETGIGEYRVHERRICRIGHHCSPLIGRTVTLILRAQPAQCNAVFPS